MSISMQKFPGLPVAAQDRSGERGAALVMMLLVSMLLLAAGGALIMTTALSATNAIDVTAETQAFYAAEAGMQSALNVLRGNVAPLSPSATAADNKVTFRQAVTAPNNMSRWLSYDATHSRVPISNLPYKPINGMAYKVEVTDPDNRGVVIFRVTGSFPANNNTSFTTASIPSNNRTGVITYSPPDTNPATINSSGTAPFGKFQVAFTTGSSGTYDISTLYPNGIDFNLTITQTSPFPATSASPLTVVIPCKIRGVISSTASLNTVRLSIVPPATNPTSTSNNIGDVTYARTTNEFPITFTGTTTINPVNITAPQPNRVLIKVWGYGPRAAEKRMQMLVSRFAFDYTANAAITLRSADSGLAMSMFSIGSSANYTYSGNDNSGGAAVPAFAVTSTADHSLVTLAVTGNLQVTGSAAVQQVPIPSLPSFLQTAQGARDAVAHLREIAKNKYYPIGSTGAANDRYFPAGTEPATYGTVSEPLTTFVDGDAVLPTAGGAGLLVVTGTLDMTGNADFKGLVMVLGAGKVIRNGGGNGTTLGAMIVASFGNSGNFLGPYFDSNGSGTAGLSYDSKWVDTAFATASPNVRGVSEY
jgi:hypothetical protein